jgi:hypothetical protein
MAEMPNLVLESSRRNPREYGVGGSSAAARRENPSPKNEMLMVEVVESKNLMTVFRKVVRNKGATGVYEMMMEELKLYRETKRPNKSSEGTLEGASLKISYKQPRSLVERQGFPLEPCLSVKLF